jgi:hypothetical protein
VALSNYNIKTVAPTISPAAGTYAGSVPAVIVSYGAPGATIYYTPNGAASTSG